MYLRVRMPQKIRALLETVDGIEWEEQAGIGGERYVIEYVEYPQESRVELRNKVQDLGWSYNPVGRTTAYVLKGQ